MRIFFGALALLIVLAIVGKVGVKQLEALGSVSARVKALQPASGGSRDSSVVSVPGGMPGASPAPVVDATVPMQARQIQENFVTSTTRALQAGPERTRRAEP